MDCCLSSLWHRKYNFCTNSSVSSDCCFFGKFDPPVGEASFPHRGANFPKKQQSDETEPRTSTVDKIECAGLVFPGYKRRASPVKPLSAHKTYGRVPKRRRQR